MSDLDNITTEVPPSSIELHKSISTDTEIINLYKQVHELYNVCEPEAEKCYRKGTVVKIKQDYSSENVLIHIIDLYLDHVRYKLVDIKEEERRKHLEVELRKIHNTLHALVSMLNKDEFLLDINSVLHIIHGYVNVNICDVFEHYETRRRITHRHDSHRAH